MTKKIKFYLDTQGVQQEIYRGDGIEQLERRVVEKTIAEIEAAFLNTFGYPGQFKAQLMYRPVHAKGAPSGAQRPVFRIWPADTQTRLTIEAQPGWLGQFAENAKL